MNPTPRRSSPASTRVTLAVVAVLVGLTLLASACGGGSSTATSTTGAGAAPATSGKATAGTTITIKDFAFSPVILRVVPGAKLTVTNDDSVTHTLTSTSGKFDTGPVGPGKSVTISAPGAAGTYPYICSIHRFMRGTLEVS